MVFFGFWVFLEIRCAVYLEFLTFRGLINKKIVGSDVTLRLKTGAVADK